MLLMGCGCVLAQRADSTFDEAMRSVDNYIMNIMRENTIPDTLPVVVWPEWNHRPEMSMVGCDQGVSGFLAHQIEHNLSCATAVRGNDRALLVRELQDQTSICYNRATGPFLTAGTAFQRSMVLVIGEWWKADETHIVFTVQVLHLLRGTRMSRPVGETPPQFTVIISSIPNNRMKTALAPHVWFNITREFAEEIRQDPGLPSSRISVIQNAATDSLSGNGRYSNCGLIVHDDSLCSEIRVTGNIRYIPCVMTQEQRDIYGDMNMYGYSVEAVLEVHWLDGRVNRWTPTGLSTFLPIGGRECWKHDASAAFQQAQGWLIERSRSPDAETALQWLLRTLCTTRQ